VVEHDDAGTGCGPVQLGQHLRQQPLHVAEPLLDAREVDAERAAADAALHVVGAGVDGDQAGGAPVGVQELDGLLRWVPSSSSQPPPRTIVTTVSPLT